MESQKLRYAATVATMTAEVAALQKALAFERQQSVRLRNALDELSEDISREAYGRRREISLRLALLAREESLQETLSRWVRKARESLESIDIGSGDTEALTKIQELFYRIILDAGGIIYTIYGETPPDEVPLGMSARVILAEHTVANLNRELQVELDKRMALVRELASANTGPPLSESLAEVSTNPHQAPIPPSPSSKRNPLLIQIDPMPTKLNGSIDKSATGDPSQFLSPSPIEVSPQSSTPTNAFSSFQASIPVPVTAPSSGHIPSDATQAPADPDHPNDTLTSTITITPSIVSHTEITPPSTVVHAEPYEEPKSDAGIVGPSLASEPQIPTGNTQQSLSEPSSTNSITFPSSDAHNDSDTSRQSEAMAVIVQAPTISTLSLQTHSSSSISREAPLQQSHPTLARLRGTKHRYNSTQRGFRDCHLALKSLKETVMAPPAADTSVTIQKAVERLDDFNEDARVELEIRIADEERLVAGYVALLSIPGAISDEINEADLDEQIRAFADGTDQAVEKNVQQFTSKLEDLQHDIACIKMYVHENSAGDDSPASAAKVLPGWSSWTAGLLTPSRPVSPSPTFGSVMTSPRLRHSSSFSRSPKQSAESLRPSSDLLSNLGLRIAMPSHAIPASSSPSSRNSTSRLDSRSRTISGLHILGLGKRAASFGYSMTPTTKSPSVSREPSLSGMPPVQDEEKSGGALESDVE